MYTFCEGAESLTRHVGRQWQRRQRSVMLASSNESRRAGARRRQHMLPIAPASSSSTNVTSQRRRATSGGDCQRHCGRNDDQCRQSDCHGCEYCHHIKNFERSLPCNDGSTNFRYCAKWCMPEQHHCIRCDCQLCDFCKTEENGIGWKPYPPPPPPSPSPPSPPQPPSPPPPRPSPPPPPPPPPPPGIPPPLGPVRLSATNGEASSQQGFIMLPHATLEQARGQLGLGGSLVVSLHRSEASLMAAFRAMGQVERMAAGLVAVLSVVACVGCLCLSLLRLRQSHGRRRSYGHGREVSKAGWHRRGGANRHRRATSERRAPRSRVDLDDDDYGDGFDDDVYDDDDDDDGLYDEEDEDEDDFEDEDGASAAGRAEREAAFDAEFDAEAARAGRTEDLATVLGFASLPAVYKTSAGASTIDVPLANVLTIDALVGAVARIGSAMVDSDISTETIRVHLAFGHGERRPRKLHAKCSLDELKVATALIITPAK